MSSYYYVWKGTTDHQTKHQWLLVSKNDIDRQSRKDRSVFCPKNGGSFNGIGAKWCDGLSASGRVLPFCVLFTNFDESKMPVTAEDDQPMIVIEVPGMCMNSHLIAGTRSPGYVVLLRKGTSMERFHRWYQDEILYKTFQTQLQRCPTFNSDERALIWFDSDMTATKETSSDEAMMKNDARRMDFCKFGAKTTHLWQACDLGDGFKIQRAASKTTTAGIDDALLQLEVDKKFNELKADGRFLLSTKKLEAVKVCIVTSSRVKQDGYTSQKNKEAFVRAGMLDAKYKLCPDLYQIMNNSGINFDSNKLLQQRFF
jgi:hypothetical protein